MRAAGLAGVRKRLGSYLPRFLASGGHDYRESIIQVLAGAVGGHFQQFTKLERRAVATGAAYLYLVPRCPACHGRAFEVRADTPMLSDVMCKVCNGTGRNEVAAHEKMRPAISWAQNQMATAEEQYSVAVGRKLGRAQR